MFTSFSEGISKTDNGTEGGAIFWLSSSSLAWCDLKNPFCASMYSRECLRQKFFPLKIVIRKLSLYFFSFCSRKTSSMSAIGVPGRIWAACYQFSSIFQPVIADLYWSRSFFSISSPQSCLKCSLCLNSHKPNNKKTKWLVHNSSENMEKICQN